MDLDGVRTFVVSCLASDAPQDAYDVTGSGTDPCIACGRLVFCAPSSRRTIEACNGRMICVGCAAVVGAIAGRDAIDVQQVPGSESDIAAVDSPEFAADPVGWAKRRLGL